MDWMEYTPGSRWYLDDGENQIVIYLDAWPCGGGGMRKLPHSGTNVNIYWLGKLMRSMEIPADAEYIFRCDRIDEFTDRITFPDGTIVDMRPDNEKTMLRRWPY